MDLATSAFATRLPAAVDQLRLAFELSLDSLALVRTDPLTRVDGLRRGLEESGGKIGVIEAGLLAGGREGEMLTADLASDDADRRQAAQLLLERHIALAAELQCPRIVLRPAPLEGGLFGDRVRRVFELAQAGGAARTGELLEEIHLLVKRSRAERLDRFCRLLFALSRRHPRVQFAFASAPSPGYFPDLDALELIFEDLHGHELYYWHDSAQAHLDSKLRNTKSWEWFERLGARLLGCDLSDVEGWSVGRTPGQGEVDFRELKRHLPQSARRVLRLDSGRSRQNVLEAIRMVRVLDLDR